MAAEASLSSSAVAQRPDGLFCEIISITPDESLSPSPVLQRLDPEQLLARGMNSVQMSTAGGLGWTPPSVQEAARLFPGYEVVAMLG